MIDGKPCGLPVTRRGTRGPWPRYCESCRDARRHETWAKASKKQRDKARERQLNEGTDDA